MTEELYAEIVKGLEKKEKLALATLIRRVGSAPRAVGAKYLVKEDGASFGSIGGGCVEAEVWEGAQKIMRDGEGGVLHFNLTAEQLAAGGLICGGNIDIFLEPLHERFLEIYRDVAKIKRKGGSALLATVVSVNDIFLRGEGSKVLLKTSGEKIGALSDGSQLEETIRREGESSVREKRPKILTVSVKDKKLRSFPSRS